MYSSIHRSSPVKTILVLLLLGVFVSLQSAAAMVTHPHNHGKTHTHCCDLCHAGHLAVLKTASVLRLICPRLIESRLAIQHYSASLDYRGVTSPSRAPPFTSTASA